MKICFVGVGSIARRHVRNLRKIFENRSEELIIDAVRSGKGKTLAEDSELHHIYYDAMDAPDDYDAVFITNPTSEHFTTLRDMRNKSNNFFIEKPVFMSGKEDWEQLNFDKKNVCYVACPLRFTNVMQYIKEHVKPEDVLSVRCISSSYLPEWRSGVDYRDTYSAHRSMGGGVEIDLIHEWDYITYLFDMPQKIMSLYMKVSDLEIDSNDIAVYIAQYKDKVVELHLDYFGRKTIRKMSLLTKDDTIEVDLIGGVVSYLRKNQIINLKEDRDEYQLREMRYFLDVIEKKRPNINDIDRACKVLKLTRGVIGYE